MTAEPMSYNGWPAIRDGRDPRLTTITIPGTPIRLRVLAGDVATILGWVATRWHREVEPLDVGHAADDWGWAYRPVRGGASLSNHASGTAIDLNATRRPFRTSASRTMTPQQIAAANRIVTDTLIDGIPMVRWLDGHDPMHWEINRRSSGATPERIARLARSITQPNQKEPPMTTTTTTTTTPRPGTRVLDSDDGDYLRQLIERNSLQLARLQETLDAVLATPPTADTVPAE